MAGKTYKERSGKEVAGGQEKKTKVRKQAKQSLEMVGPRNITLPSQKVEWTISNQRGENGPGGTFGPQFLLEGLGTEEPLVSPIQT